MNQYPKRLIEVDLPIKRISAHARREKSIRHGHISSLHIWWARRPLAACRAVICAALWPDPADELCPIAFRDSARAEMRKWTENRRLRLLGNDSQLHFDKYQKRLVMLDDNTELRQALLDFIADFANWDNSTQHEFLETSRTLTQVAHESLGSFPGTRPLVVDPFAGGGSIPLEALRVGADAFASDLNPVAVLLNKVVLEYIPKYGQRLADEVRKWGQWVKVQAEKELAEFYPQDRDGATPIAYLWARTIISEAPDDGTGYPVEVPLIRSMWLAKKKNGGVALRWKRDIQGQVEVMLEEVKYSDGTAKIIQRPQLEIFETDKESSIDIGTVAQGAATCPITGYTTPVSSVREQLKIRSGGANDARLLAVVTKHPDRPGRSYRVAKADYDFLAISNAGSALQQLDLDDPLYKVIPNEKFTGLEPRRIPVPQYGIDGFSNLFTLRQLLVLTTFVKFTRILAKNLHRQIDDDLLEAVVTILALIIGKQADLGNSLCAWEPIAQCPRHLFGKQAISMVWDFAEGVATSDSSGSWQVQIERVDHILKSLGSDWKIGQAQNASALNHPLPDDTADAFITDPPYYYSIPYSDLSDFFYVWQKRTLRDIHSELFGTELTPKSEECVQNLPHAAVSHLQKDKAFYENALTQAFREGSRFTKSSGIGIVVFAHKDTEAWEALVAALVSAKWRITASWPIQTEMESRVVAQRQSTLVSSIHLVCRPRDIDSIGDWRDILQELPYRIHDWLPRLASEGVVGADAIFACLGPALEIFSRYSHVEKASGGVVTLGEYLEQVWAAVSKEALAMVFQGADTSGFEEDARLTAMWLWTLSTATDVDVEQSNGIEDSDEDDEEASNNGRRKKSTGGYTLEYDAARKIGQGLGARLEQLPHLIQVKGSIARLLPVDERTRYLLDQPSLRAESSRKRGVQQTSLFEMLPEAEKRDWLLSDDPPLQAGQTVLDRIHQSMLLFAAGHSEALRRFLVDEGVGHDERFWRLGQALSALYPTTSNEKRWVDGVLARKKGLGFA